MGTDRRRDVDGGRDDTRASYAAPVKAVDREILRLAVPAFLALVAEPLFLLSDAAIVGHLGTPELAGLGVAAVILQTVVGLCVFLAYGTTASVARHLGAGDLRAALAQGVDGVWLAILIGTVATVGGILATPALVAAFDTGSAVAGHAETYLAIAFLGTTPLLVMLAATGVLRGLQDTRTPLHVAVVGNALNIALNVLLVYGLDLGIAGSAIGSVIAQVLSAAWLVAVVVRAAREHGAPLSPDRAGILAAAHAAVALVIRTLALRACLLVGTYAVTRVGTQGTDVNVATHQIAMTLWTFLAFALDAIAIAAQALTGRALGSGDAESTRQLTRRMIRWGWGSGIVAGLGLAAVAPFIGAAVHQRPRGARAARAGAARGRAGPAAGRGRVRARRRAHRRRRRCLPRVGRARGAGGVRPGRPVGGHAAARSRRRLGGDDRRVHGGARGAARHAGARRPVARDRSERDSLIHARRR